MLTQTLVRKIFDYDPNKGRLTWRATGRVAGYPVRCRSRRRGETYWSVELRGKQYRAHRIAWLYVTGEWARYVVPLDGDGLNLRWNNLQKRTWSEVQRNRRRLPKGVFKDKGQWVAHIQINGERIRLRKLRKAKECARRL